MPTTRIKIYLACVGVLTAIYYAVPSWHIFSWTAIGLSSAACVITGILIHKPRRILPWVLIAASLVCFTLGDTTFLLLTDVLHQIDPFPSVADGFYLVMYPMLAVGVLLLPRSTDGKDWSGMIDALILSTGMVLILWAFLFRQLFAQPAPDLWAHVISMAYPVGDILIIFTVSRLLTSVERSPTVILMAVGGGCLLVADVLYGLAQLQDNWRMGGPVDLWWIFFYATWGAAGLHPTMARLTEPRLAPEPPHLSPLRFTALALSALAAPVVLLVESRAGRVTDGEMIAFFSAALFLLVLLRLAGLVSINGQTVARERGLREAGAALVAASDPDAVRSAVQQAVGRLLPPNTPHATWLELRDRGAEAPDSGRCAQIAKPTTAGAIQTTQLPPRQAEALGAFKTAYAQPLFDDGEVTGPGCDTLLVAAEPKFLAVLQGPIGVLASQAALAVDRIALNSEITRRNSEQYFRTLVHNTTDVILILTATNHIRYASPSAANMLGEVAEPGHAILDLVEDEQRGLAAWVLELVRSGQAGAATADWRIVRRDGVAVEVEVSGRDLSRDPTVRGVVLTLRDVTDRRRLERELRHQAFHDSLTGLANRVLFTERVDQAIARGAQSQALIGVLFIDLDDFKIVNDTLGHQIGDELLIAVAHRLDRVLRTTDTAARLGGDEFAVLIEDGLDVADIEQTAERIVRSLSDPVILNGNLVSTSASIGISTTTDAEDGSDLLRLADLALYVAKGAGKGRWQRYQSALHSTIVQRLELRSLIDKALSDGEFVLHYQPIVNLTDRTTAGFEALVRWQHPQRGLLGPGEFIDIAEESGQIVQIGSWVLRRALADAKELAGPTATPYVSVNVSARQFRTPAFVDLIRAELAASGLPPTRLMLEITESVLLPDDDQIWADLAALRETGVRIAIDDFGTGYSALSYMRQSPIDVIKLDKSFIDTMATSTQQRALVEGIVRLAGTLGLEVIAEGIAREGDLRLLTQIGCGLGQGFYFARPLSRDDAAKWLDAAGA